MMRRTSYSTTARKVMAKRLLGPCANCGETNGPFAAGKDRLLGLEICGRCYRSHYYKGYYPKNDFGIHGLSGEERIRKHTDFTGRDGRWIYRDSPCFLLDRYVISVGYCRLTVDNTRVLAHRFMFELLVGPIPDGFTVGHKCHDYFARRGRCIESPCIHRRCWNPLHLERETMSGNLRSSPNVAWNRRSYAK